MKILDLTFKRDRGENLAEALRSFGHDAVFDGITLSRKNPFTKLWKLASLVMEQRNRQDVIIVENPLWDACAALLIIRFSSCKPYLIYYSKGFSPEVTLNRGIQRIFKKVAMLILERIMRRADHVVYISEWLRNRYFENSGFAAIELKPSSVIHHAPNPFFLEAPAGDFDLDGFERSSNGIKLCYAGSFHSWDKASGVLMIFDVVNRIISNYHDYPVSLYLAGKGRLRSELEEIAHKKGLGDSVKFVGQINLSELRGLYRSCDIFVYPSSQDGCPTVVMEAQACGLPAIVTDSCGAAELVKDGVSGYVCSLDEEALYEALLELISDRAKRMLMGQKARQHILQNLTWEISAAKFNSILPSI